MKKFALIFTFLMSLSYLESIAQISSIVASQDASCSYNTDGSITIDSITACFAPIQVSAASQNFVFNSLKNDGYVFINQGEGTGNQEAYSVWSGSTSTGPVYISTGTFESAATFGTNTLTSNPNAPLDMFIVCYDENTSGVNWALKGTSSGASAYTAGYAVTGAGDKAYVTGYFTGTMTLGTQSVVSSGGYQAYLAKIDIPSGTVDTIVQYGGTGVQEGFNLRYAEGRIYLVGNNTGAITIAGNTFNTAGQSDIYVAAIDTNMVTEYWSIEGGVTTANTYVTDVVPYVNSGVVEKVYIVGTYFGTATFGTQSITSAGNRDFYVAELDTTETWNWAVSGGSPQIDYCTTIDINSTGDRLYVGGWFVNTMTFDGQSFSASVGNDGFIGYMNASGSLDTLYQLSGTSEDYVKDLQSLDDDYLIFTGQTSGTLNYADSSFTSNGQADAFLGKIGPAFHEIWGKNFGGTAIDDFYSVHRGTGTRLHVSGYFRNDASQYQTGLVSTGAKDALVTNDQFLGLVDTTINLTGLTAGTYYINYADSNGNTMVDTVLLGPDSILLSAVVVNASSGTANDGSIDLTVTGGVPGYTYAWSNGASTQDIDSLTAGTYCVTVTDTNGCIDSSCFVVGAGSSGALTAIADLTHLTCFGDSNGAIDLTVFGGIPPYSYLWNTGDTIQDLTDLVAGTYIVAIIDNDTTTSFYQDTFIITEPSQIIATEVITPPTSGTSSDGEIDLTVSGGIPPYSFIWNTGDVTEDLDSLTVGAYMVTITDSNGCQIIESFAVDTLPAMSLVSVSGDVTCLSNDNGSIDLTVIGGVGPFTYAWSNGETTEDIQGLAAGTYTVTVTDSANQSASLTDTIESNPIHAAPVVGPIAGPASVQAWSSYNYNVPSSTGSSFDWSVSGGTVTNGANNAAVILWYAGPSGTVRVYETDLHGCIGSDSLTVDILFVGINESAENAILVYPNPASEFLNIDLPVNFGVPSITVINAVGQVVKQPTSLHYRNQIDISDLAAGTYFVQIDYSNLDIHLTQSVIIQ